MHDLLGKTEFMERHVATFLREGRPVARPNAKFGLRSRNSSPIREYTRKRFRESLACMITRVYKAPDYSALPEEQV